MKKIWILFSLALYLFGASYFIHVEAMSFPWIEENSVSNHCEHTNETKKSDNKNNDQCFDTCVWQYWELNYLDKIELHHNQQIYFPLDQLLNINFKKIDNEKIFFVHPPPDNVFLYDWFVGKITVIITWYKI